jgi:hypothetical protein
MSITYTISTLLKISMPILRKEAETLCETTEGKTPQFVQMMIPGLLFHGNTEARRGVVWCGVAWRFSTSLPGLN